MTSDFRVALRTLGKSPAFTITAVLALAFGIGANTAIFSLVNQVLLNPTGVSDPDRVVAVRTRYDKLNLQSIGMSNPGLADVRKSTQLFEAAAATEGGDFNYTGGDVPERLQGAAVTEDWFRVFGATAVAGRFFRTEEDAPTVNRVVVLAHPTWMRLFGGERSAIGRKIELNQTPYEIIGVAAPDFRWPQMVDIWVPLGLSMEAYAENNRFNEHLQVYARMKPGGTVEQANALMGVLSDNVKNNGTPGGAYAKTSSWGMFAVPLTDFVAGDTKRPMLVLLGAVGFVLLIACSNIAGLMLARTATRAREIAVRAALGGTRLQLLRHTFAEAVILAVVGSAAGLALAYAAMRVLLASAPERAVAGIAVRMDGPVLLFTAGLTFLSALLFSLPPAWHIAKADPFLVLKGSGRSGTAGPGRQRMRATLVICETALALMLLAGTGLFLRSFSRIEQLNPGFDPRGVMTAIFSLPRNQYDTPEKQVAFYRALTERLQAAPGASQAALGLPLPFSGGGSSGSFNIEGRTLPPGEPPPHGDSRWITPAYFEALRIPIRKGRVFTDQDRLDTERVFVIDETLAGQYWPGEDPVGKRMRRGTRAPWSTIIGVVGHVKSSDLAEETNKGVYYTSLYQQPMPVAMVAIRTPGNPAPLAAAIREAVGAVDSRQPVHTIRTMEGMIDASLAPRRFTVRILEFFALSALVLAALGLYGVINYSVSQRTQEIGVRMALGAQRASVLGLVVGQGLRLAGVGVAVGIVAAMAGARVLQAQLYGVSALDPVTFSLTAMVLVGAAALASYIPARRATRIDPLEALRYE